MEKEMVKQQSKSLQLQAQAKKRIPGMSQLLSKRPDMFTLGVWPAYYSRAEGARVWDLDGNKFLDMSIGGIGACVLGYADPDVDKAVISAVQGGVASSLNCPAEVELAEVLCELHPWADMVRFARAGGEAMSIAVRIARASTGWDVVAFCGYHGWSDWYLAANVGTQDALGGHLLPGLDPAGVPQGLGGTAVPFRYNHLEELERIVAEQGDKLAAIVMEPVRNILPAPGFLEGVRSLADKTGAVMIFDEISAGFRLTAGGAHLLYGVDPDIAVFSKALGNGYAISAVVGREQVMEAAQNSFISSTCWTERIGPTAALATIEKFRLLDAGKQLVESGRKVQDGWTRCAKKRGLNITVSGIEPLSHFSFNHEEALSLKALFIQEMLDRGILASNLYYAMLAHTEQDIEQYLTAVDKAFAVLAEAISDGSLSSRLRGKPSQAGFARLT